MKIKTKNERHIGAVIVILLQLVDAEIITKVEYHAYSRLLIDCFPSRDHYTMWRMIPTLQRLFDLNSEEELWRVLNLLRGVGLMDCEWELGGLKITCLLTDKNIETWVVSDEKPDESAAQCLFGCDYRGLREQLSSGKDYKEPAGAVDGIGVFYSPEEIEGFDLGYREIMFPIRGELKEELDKVRGSLPLVKELPVKPRVSGMAVCIEDIPF